MFITYIRNRRSFLLEQRHILSMFTFLYDRPVHDAALPLPDGEIVFTSADMTPSNAEYGYYENGELKPISTSKTNNKGVPFAISDVVDIVKGDIANYTDTKTISTTVGRYITNYLLIASVMGNKIPYVNTVWKIGKVEDLMATLLLDESITVQQYRKYLDNGYFIGHFGELCIPTLTPKAMMTDPNIAIRKKELLEENKDKLDDPKVIAAIEDELIAMDIKWLENDPSANYFGYNSGKSYNIQRKKMFIMLGGTPDYNTESKTQLVDHSLEEGLSAKNFTMATNDSRKGSAGRGLETKAGGAMTKTMFRAFQDVVIDIDDCKSTVGIKITFDNNIKPSSFIGRSIIVGTKVTEITKSNVESFNGKTVNLRSPMTCKHKSGFCYVCAGMNYKRLHMSTPGTESIEISSKFLNLSMKQMHGTATNVTTPNMFDFFK